MVAIVGSLATRLTVDDGILVSGLGRAGSSLQRFERQSNTTLGKVDAKFAALGRTATALGSSLIGIFAGSQVLRGAAQLIDTSTRIQNSLKVAGLAGEDLTKVYDELYASAQRNAVPLENLAQLYSRVSLVQKELGASTEEMLAFTDRVAMALRVAGTDAQSASGALLQLSQAMGSGVVRAEEFNSILEGALPIAQAVAAGLDEAGGSVAKLRALVVEGKVSSEAFFRAFEAGAVTLEEKVANAEMTISQGFIRLQNVLVDLAGKFDDATGSSASFAAVLDQVATSLSNLEGSRIISWLGELNRLLESSGFLQLESSLREIEAVLRLLDGAAGAVADSFDGAAGSIEQAIAWALGFDQVSDAPVALQQNIEALSASIVDGETDADELRAALAELGAAPVNMAIQIADIMALAEAARIARGEITALNSGPAADGIALQRDEQSLLRGLNKPAPKPISLADYPITPGSVSSSSGGSSSGGSGTSDAERHQQAIDDLVASLEAERAAIGMSATEQRVMNELRSLGITETDAQGAAIASMIREVEAGTASYERMQQAMETAQGLAQGFASDLVSGLMAGKDATEVLGNAVENLMGKLIEMALNQLIMSLIGSLFGGPMGGMGGSMLGGMGFKLFAEGGKVRGPGTATSDSIPAMLSDGEYVVNARAAGKHAALLEAINSDRMGIGSVAHLADGGFAGSMPGGGEVHTPRQLDWNLAA
ncbi:MAG TPA: tape measure protein [Devosia sp.]|nr:tape measure protein [Devosia sp.]